MKTYKIIQENEVTHVFKSNQSLDFLNTNPALFFLFDGNYEIERCGKLRAFELLKSHCSRILNNWRKINEFTK